MLTADCFWRTCRCERERTLSTSPWSSLPLSTGSFSGRDVARGLTDDGDMNAQSLTVIRSSTNGRPSVGDLSSGNIIRIQRGRYVMIHRSGPPMTYWEIWALVARARLLVVSDSSSCSPVFVGASSFVARSIPLWEANPDIVIWCASRHGRRSMPAVTMQTVTIPATYVCSTVKKPCERSVEIVERLRCESVVEAAVRMACYSERLSGFVAICMALHHESQFVVLSQEESRRRAERVRSKMFECLDLYRQQKECVPYRRAQRLIAAADPGCDNPAEAALLWVLKSVSAFEVVTQFEIVVNGRRYFADIAIPGLMIVFEFDGIGKLGKDDAEFARAKRDWIQRENDLRSAGWRIHRVSWRDYEDFAALRAWAIKLLRPHQVAIPEHAEALWALPTAACDGPSRRFHVHAR